MMKRLRNAFVSLWAEGLLFLQLFRAMRKTTDPRLRLALLAAILLLAFGPSKQRRQFLAVAAGPPA